MQKLTGEPQELPKTQEKSAVVGWMLHLALPPAQSFPHILPRTLVRAFAHSMSGAATVFCRCPGDWRHAGPRVLVAAAAVDKMIARSKKSQRLIEF